MLLKAKVVFGAAASAGAGAVHLSLIAHHVVEGDWLVAGAFLLDGLALIAVAWLLLSRKTVWSWLISGAVCATTAGAYVVSRIIGYPGGHHGVWDPVGVTTTLAELAVGILAVHRAGWLSRPRHVRRLGAVVLVLLLAPAAGANPAVEVPTNEFPRQAAAVTSASATLRSDEVADAPEGCRSIARRISLYAVELPPDNGEVRLGFGLTPDSASIPGPLIEMVEGECIAITVENEISVHTLEALKKKDTPTGVSLHVHGVKYTSSSDGTAHHGSFVAPGRARTFIWYAAPRLTVAGRVASLGSAGYWWYHDHVIGTTHGTGGLGAGLFGGLIVRRPGDPLPARTYTAVMGPASTINLRSYPATYTCESEPAPSDTCFIAKEGERIEFLVFNVGDEFHTFHLHGHNWANNRTGMLASQHDETQLIDVRGIGPSESFGFQVVAGEEVGPGRWMLHCHVQVHSDLGMATYFHVEPSSGMQLPSLPEHDH